MLGQYRQMAKISPFLVKASEEAASKGSLMSRSESNLSYKSNEDVIQELKVLSQTISKMKNSSVEASQLVSNEANEILKSNQTVRIMMIEKQSIKSNMIINSVSSFYQNIQKNLSQFEYIFRMRLKD